MSLPAAVRHSIESDVEHLQPRPGPPTVDHPGYGRDYTVTLSPRPTSRCAAAGRSVTSAYVRDAPRLDNGDVAVAGSVETVLVE